jgi:hypothetical protein
VVRSGLVGPVDGVRELLTGATLPAGRLQHLLVLLLTHALAALLDQGSHEPGSG